MNVKKKLFSKMIITSMLVALVLTISSSAMAMGSEANTYSDSNIDIVFNRVREVVTEERMKQTDSSVYLKIERASGRFRVKVLARTPRTVPRTGVDKTQWEGGVVVEPGKTYQIFNRAFEDCHGSSDGCPRDCCVVQLKISPCDGGQQQIVAKWSPDFTGSCPGIEIARP